MYPAIATQCSHGLARATFSQVILRQEIGLLWLQDPFMGASFGIRLGWLECSSVFNGGDGMSEDVMTSPGRVKRVISAEVLDQKWRSLAWKYHGCEHEII